MLRRLRHSRSSGGRLFQRLGGYRRWARNVLFISDARNGAVMYTLQMKRKRWSVESRMSYFRSIFKFISNDDNNDHKNIRNNLASTEDIAIWKGPSTSGRPYLILSGLLHDMNFDIFTTTTTTSNTQQQQQRRRKRKRGGGSVVGVVSKDLFDKREALRDNGRYGVHVQPGYDCALFVLLAIIVDELFNHHHPGSISEKAYESLVGSGPRCGGQETTAVTHKGMETTTTATDRTESLISAEEESIPMSLGFSLIMTSSSCGESFSDIEDRMREKASLLEEHLMYRSGSLS